MAGLADTNVIDLVTSNPDSGEVALIMCEDRPWRDSPEQLEQIRKKINSYAAFVLDEGFIRSFPHVVGKPIRIQLDCAEPPTSEVAALIAIAREHLAEYHINFEVNVLP